jgi:hypothetical protein
MKLSDTLKDLMQIISPYAYERIRFVFEIILKTEPEDQVAKKGISILDVLSNFNRNHQPSDDEVVSVLTRYPELRNSGEKSRIDFFLKHFPAAGTRLPYHETVMNPWTILAVELSEQTIFRLVPLALPLGIPSDKFYLVVVNNLLQRLVRFLHSNFFNNGAQKIENHLDSAALNKIFIDVKGIMLKIKDATTSIGTWLHVAEAFPPGTDRIQSYKTAQILVDKWQRQLSTIKVSFPKIDHQLNTG